MYRKKMMTTISILTISRIWTNQFSLNCVSKTQIFRRGHLIIFQRNNLPKQAQYESNHPSKSSCFKAGRCKDFCLARWAFGADRNFPELLSKHEPCSWLSDNSHARLPGSHWLLWVCRLVSRFKNKIVGYNLWFFIDIDLRRKCKKTDQP
jgi:hypothetical protein